MIGPEIKKYIETKGIKQAYIVQKTGIPKERLCMILNGSRRLEAEEFLRICKAIEVSAEYFAKLV